MSDFINTTFEIPNYIEKGLKSGSLFRYGSEIRVSKGFQKAGTIFANLKEVTDKAHQASNLVNNTAQSWKALSSIAKNSAQAGAVNPALGIITAISGVADLGVNIWGHTKTHKKLDEGFEKTDSLIKENFENTNNLICTGFSNTNNVLNNVMALSSIGSAASVLNLGLSAVGFIMMNHKINNLTNNTHQLRNTINNVSSNLDGISNQILELKYLQLEHKNELKDFFVEALFQQKFDESLSNLKTYINFIYDDRVDNNLLLNISKEKNYLEDKINTLLSKDKDYSIAMINIHRAWTMAGIAEVFAFRMLKDLDKSSEIAQINAKKSREWSNTFIDKMFPNNYLNGIYMFGNDCFEEKITEDQKKRLSIIYQKGEVLNESEVFDQYSKGSEEVLLNKNATEEWQEKQIALANTLDMLEEVNERMESLANEMKFCSENNILPEDWELKF